MGRRQSKPPTVAPNQNYPYGQFPGGPYGYPQPGMQPYYRPPMQQPPYFPAPPMARMPSMYNSPMMMPGMAMPYSAPMAPFPSSPVYLRPSVPSIPSYPMQQSFPMPIMPMMPTGMGLSPSLFPPVSAPMPMQPIPAGPPVWVGKIGSTIPAISTIPSFSMPGSTQIIPGVTSTPIVTSSMPIAASVIQQPPSVTTTAARAIPSDMCCGSAGQTTSSRKCYDAVSMEPPEHPVSIRIIDQRTRSQSDRLPSGSSGFSCRREINELLGANRSLMRHNERLMGEIRRLSRSMGRRNNRRNRSDYHRRSPVVRDRGHYENVRNGSPKRTFGRSPDPRRFSIVQDRGHYKNARSASSHGSSPKQPSQKPPMPSPSSSSYS